MGEILMAARCDVCGYHLESEGAGFVCFGCAYNAVKRLESLIEGTVASDVVSVRSLRPIVDAGLGKDHK